MSDSKPTVAFAAEKTDTDSWAIKSFIQDCGIAVMPMFSGEDLIEGLRSQLLHPTAVFLSATSTRGPISSAITEIREFDSDIPVVLVVANGSLELERETRRRGIFYYLTLPAGRDEVEKVTMSAVHAHRR